MSIRPRRQGRLAPSPAKPLATPKSAPVARHRGPLGSPCLAARLNLAGVSASSRSCVFGDRHRSKASLQKAPSRRDAAGSTRPTVYRQSSSLMNAKETVRTSWVRAVLVSGLRFLNEHLTWCPQFVEGCSARSMTRTSTGPLVASSFRPSCSRRDVISPARP